MSQLKEMVSTLFQRAIQTFKEYGASDIEIINSVREAEDVFKKLHFDDVDKVDEIVDAMNKEVSKLDKKD